MFHVKHEGVKMASRKTVNQRQFEKERKRLLKGLRRWERQGYIFRDAPSFEMPKRVTKKTLENLRKTKPKDLLKFAVTAGEGGEIIRGDVAYKQQRSESAKKAALTRKLNKQSERAFFEGRDTGFDVSQLPNEGITVYKNVLEDFIEKLTLPSGNYTPFGRARNKKVVEEGDKQKNILLSLIRTAVANEGEENVGLRLQAKQEEIYSLIEYVLYGSSQESVQSASRKLAEIIKGSPLTMKQLIDVTEQAEFSEDNDII